MQLIKVKSLSTPDKTYTVRQMDDFSWRCSCPSFIFNEGKMRRAGKVPICNHIRKARHQKIRRLK